MATEESAVMTAELKGEEGVEKDDDSSFHALGSFLKKVVAWIEDPHIPDAVKDFIKDEVQSITSQFEGREMPAWLEESLRQDTYDALHEEDQHRIAMEEDEKFAGEGDEEGNEEELLITTGALFMEPDVLERTPHDFAEGRKKAAANALRGGKKGDKSKTDKGEEDFTGKKGSKSETHEGEDFEEK